MADTYVLVHGAWHTGAEMEAVAGHLRKSGHVVHCPTVAGNNKDDDREKIGLEQAISSSLPTSKRTICATSAWSATPMAAW